MQCSMFASFGELRRDFAFDSFGLQTMFLHQKPQALATANLLVNVPLVKKSQLSRNS